MKASFYSENSPESGRLVLLYKNLHLSWAGDQAHGPEHWLRAWIFGCWVIPPAQWWETESYLQSSGEKLSHTASPVVRNWVIPPVQWETAPQTACYTDMPKHWENFFWKTAGNESKDWQTGFVPNWKATEQQWKQVLEWRDNLQSESYIHQIISIKNI
jgi:hypothetical protein